MHKVNKKHTLTTGQKQKRIKRKPSTKIKTEEKLSKRDLERVEVYDGKKQREQKLTTVEVDDEASGQLQNIDDDDESLEWENKMPQFGKGIIKALTTKFSLAKARIILKHCLKAESNQNRSACIRIADSLASEKDIQTERDESGREGYHNEEELECAVTGCLSTSDDHQLFKIPEQPGKFDRWMKLIGRPHLVGRDRVVCYVCEVHFPPKAFTCCRTKQLLTRTAAPALKLPSFSQAAPKDLPPQELPPKEQPSTATAESSARSAPSKIEVLPEKILMPSKCATRTAIDVLLQRMFPPRVVNLIRTQSRLKSALDKQRLLKRPTIENFFLLWYHANPASYMALRKPFQLPSKKTLLSMYVAAVKSDNSELLETMQASFTNMSKLEKYCVVLISKVKLKPHLYYNITEDKVYGFCKNGDDQEPQLARYAVTVIARGLYKKWIRPVHQVLLAADDSSVTYSWIRAVISKLIDAGLVVRICVSNIRSSAFVENDDLKVTVNKPYFYINKHKIYYAYDPTYLIQNVYWHLMSHDFHFKNSVAKWQDILQFYESDCNKAHRLVPELTSEHVCPSEVSKMSSRLATETLSERVAAAIANYVDFELIKPAAMGTVKLLMMVSRLYKFLTSSKATPSCEYQKPFCASDTQLNFIVEALSDLRDLRLYQNDVDVTDVSNTKFIKHFQTTIRAILLLYEDLVAEYFTQLSTCDIGLNIFDRLYDNICKESKTKEITAWKLISDYRKLLFDNALKTTKRSSCPEWVGKVLQEHLQDSNAKQTFEQTPNKPLRAAHLNLKIKESDYRNIILPSKDQLTPICHYLLAKSCERHGKCYLTIRRQHLLREEYISLRDILFKEGKMKLDMPVPDNMLNFIKILESRLEKCFDDHFQNGKTLTGTNVFVDDLFLKFDPPCKCFPVLFMIKLYVRLRIWQQMKANNRRIINCPSENLLFRFEKLR